VGATAVTARIGIPRAVRARSITAPAPAFDELGGPLVAVCGVAGGAGASTLSLLLARESAAASSAPVLLSEADAVAGGLAALAGAAAPYSLVGLAQRLAADAAPSQTFIELEPGLRLVASAPQRPARCDPDAIRVLLREARAAHGLVVIDCGTGWTADSAVVAAASHILWCVPATPTALARSGALLGSDVMPVAGRHRELLIAIARDAEPRVRVRRLHRLAARRCDGLILIPHSVALARGERVVGEACVHAVAGIASMLRRQT
jgi:cellulose biosynthesis protein BcsQ